LASGHVFSEQYQRSDGVIIDKKFLKWSSRRERDYRDKNAEDQTRSTTYN